MVADDDTYTVRKNTGQGFCLAKALSQSTGIPFRVLLQKNAETLAAIPIETQTRQFQDLFQSICPKGRRACLRTRQATVAYKPVGRKNIPRKMWATFLDVVIYSMALEQCIVVYRRRADDGLVPEFETCPSGGGSSNSEPIRLLRTDDHVELLEPHTTTRYRTMPSRVVTRTCSPGKKPRKAATASVFKSTGRLRDSRVQKA